MHDVTPEAVRTMAAAAQMSLTADDVVEVAHRINAFLTALAPLSSLSLEHTAPRPVETER